jgi:hypothetical protein
LAIIRFYQIEWLCNLPVGARSKQLLQTIEIPVINPTICAVSQSRRFPLLSTESAVRPTWKGLMPECRDPRDVATCDWDSWVPKATYSNTGDRSICAILSLVKSVIA